MEDDHDLTASIEDAARTSGAVNKALGNPIALLLGPSAKLIGERWGEKTEAWLTRKQKENIEAKIERAEAERPVSLGPNTTPRQIGAMIEWTHFAKDIDETVQPTLALLWSKALVDITQSNFVLLDALSDMKESEIKKFMRGGTLRPQELIEFETRGLLRRDYPSKTLTLRQRLEPLLWSALVVIGMNIGLVLAKAPNEMYLSNVLLGIGVATILMFSMMLTRETVRWKITLTNLGHAVLRQAGVDELPYFSLDANKRPFY